MIRMSLPLLPAAAQAWAVLFACLLMISSCLASTTGSTLASTKNNKRKLSVVGHLETLPDTGVGAQWHTLEDGVTEFQPASQDIRHLKKRSGAGSTSGYENIFVDGSGTYYNDYAQAWRLLGFYIDCNAPLNNVNECYDDGGGGGGGDGGGGDADGSAACQRYLLWAAYVDPDYSGGGIGEYQFYDRHSHSWDTRSCRARNGRCAKMDCHLRQTNFQLLGFFKEPNYHEWMEQLFKHQGVCLWTDAEYSFMQTDRYLWPCYCTSTGQVDEDGNTLYYDTKPMPEGRIGIGLYTDNRCKYDYVGDQDVLDILQKGGGDRNDYDSVTQLKQGLEEWNDAFDVFKVCQPCKAYDLGYMKSNNEDRRQAADDDDKNNGGQTSFSCYDDADYTNVNQCMKFRTKTEMLAADFRDLTLAHQQGNIVQFEVMGKTYGYGGYRTKTGSLVNEKFNILAAPGVPLRTWAFLIFSLVFCILALIFFVRVKRRQDNQQNNNRNLKVPLMSK